VENLDKNNKSSQKDVDRDGDREHSLNSTCFKGVPQIGDRCAYYMIIPEAMKSGMFGLIKIHTSRLYGLKEVQTGTTTLWYTLMQSPYIAGRSVRCNYDIPLSQCLDQVPAVKPETSQVLIDKGPNGGRCESLIKKMSETLPHVKLVFLFRHPIDRLYSHWNHNLVKEYLPKGKIVSIKVSNVDKHIHRTKPFIH